MSVLMTELGFEFFMKVVALDVSFPMALKSPKMEIYNASYVYFRK